MKQAIPHPNFLRGNLLAIAAILLWSTNFPVVEMLVQSWHPLLLATARLSSSALCLLVMLALLRKLPRLSSIPTLPILIYGGGFLGLATVMQTFAVQLAGSVMVAIIGTAMPLISAIIGYVFAKEPLGMLVMIGIAFAIVGGVISSVTGMTLDVSLGLGELLMLLSTIMWTLYARGLVLHLGHLDNMTGVALCSLAGSCTALTLSAIALALGLATPIYDLSINSIGAIIWLGGFAVGLSTVIFIAGSRILSVTIASMHLNIVPFYVMMISLTLGGVLVWQQFWGAALVVVGAILAQFAKRTSNTP
jgi:drug/metabolite transporter (DMT)-like permease